MSNIKQLVNRLNSLNERLDNKSANIHNTDDGSFAKYYELFNSIKDKAKRLSLNLERTNAYSYDEWFESLPDDVRGEVIEELIQAKAMLNHIADTMVQWS